MARKGGKDKEIGGWSEHDQNMFFRIFKELTKNKTLNSWHNFIQ